MGELVSESLRAARTLAILIRRRARCGSIRRSSPKHKVEGWSDMPVWIAPQGDEAAFAATSAARALNAGLNITPMRKTVRDTLAWHLKRPEAERTKLKAGIEPEREKEILAAWHAMSTVARTA